jgi:hypothetical protein
VVGLGRIGNWRHATGATHLHSYTDRAESGFGLTVRTEATDDHGAAHVLEHLVGAGSVAYPMGSALYTAMFRGMSPFLNGFTESGRTSFTFVVGDADDHADILKVLLDAVYRPLLAEREFLREGCRHRRGRAGGEGGFAGIVYNEMRMRRETERQWVSRLVARAQTPGGAAQYRHEGSPQALPGLEYQACLRLHQQWYRAAQMHSFSCGPNLEIALHHLDAAHELAQTRSPDSGPGTPDLDATGPTAALIGPVGLPASAWRVIRTVVPAAASGHAWSHAFQLRAALRPPPGALVIGPQLSNGQLELLVALRMDDTTGGESAGKSLTRRTEQICRELTDLATDDLERLPKAPLATVAAQLSMPYAPLPEPVRWGLAVAAPRVRGMDPVALLAPGAMVPHPPAEISVLEVSSGGHVLAAPSWSARRAQADQSIWDGPPVGRSAACLPIRPLSQRNFPPLPRALRVADHLYHVPDAPAGLYLHSRLPVDPAFAHLAVALRDFVGECLGLAPSRLAACGRVTARVDHHRAGIVDMLLPSDTPADTRARLAALAEDLDDARYEPLVRTACRAYLRRRSAALLTAPAEFAWRTAAGRTGVAGTAAELTYGISALRELRTALNATTSLLPAVRRMVTAWSDAYATVIVTGKRVTRDARAAAAQLPVRRLPAAPSLWLPTPPPVRLEGISDERAVTCGVWSTPAFVRRAPEVLLVLSAHLHRRYLHERVREMRGAYAVGAGMNPFDGTFAVWSEADPEPDASLRLYRELHADLEQDGTTSDDLLTAQLMAVADEKRRRCDLTYLAALRDRDAAARDTGAGPDPVAAIRDVDAGALTIAARALRASPYYEVSVP